jgi:hypothetical protein
MTSRSRGKARTIGSVDQDAGTPDPALVIASASCLRSRIDSMG